MFKSGDQEFEGEAMMSVEDYPSQEVALRVQLQRAVEEERSGFSSLTSCSGRNVCRSPLRRLGMRWAHQGLLCMWHSEPWTCFLIACTSASVFVMQQHYDRATD